MYIPSERPEYALLADMIISSLERENKLMKEEPKEDGLVIENAVADPYEVAELYLARRCFRTNCGIYTTCEGEQINIACVKLGDVLGGSAY
ncbi:MAG: hypothetical protein JZD41_02075 [Thermoproteus sp.]|nr:hypothetical protein [Thermoproteus sp.]